jgi:isovaleryl-CoA dehydrogenase
MVKFEEIIKDVAKFVAAKAGEIDKNNEMDRSIIKKLFDKMLMGTLTPEQYGGLGKGYVEASMLAEELGKVSGGIAHSVVVHNMVVDAFRRFGNDEQKRKYLKKLTSEHLGAIAITEPTGGSDVASAIKLKAERRGDSYVLNGVKTLITNSTLAEIFIVVGRTGESAKGLTAFIVERSDGIEIVKLNPSGMRGSGLGTVRFRDVEVPVQNILVGEGKGMRVALGTLAPNRVPFAAMGLGIAENCLEMAINRAKKREAFGQRIADFQAIQFMLAELATDIESTRSLIYRAAEIANTDDVTVLAAMCKLKSAEVAKKAADLVVEIHGGYGIIAGTPADRAYRDAKIIDIAEGTSEMMKLIISRSILV